MTDDETIHDLINKAGGYTENAYPFGAVYENNDAKLINRMASDELYKEFLDNIIMMSQQNVDGIVNLDSIINLTEEIKYSKPNGRIVIDILSDSGGGSISLKDGDKVTIPEKQIIFMFMVKFQAKAP